MDSQPAWATETPRRRCAFFTKRHETTLLRAAVAHVRKQGGRILEGYPQDAKGRAMPDVFAWTGVASAYRKAGFDEVARPSPRRPIMRCECQRGGRAFARDTNRN